MWLVELLATGDTNKNDPNDARSVAVAALRSPTVGDVQAEDHAKVMEVWAKRHRDLSSHRIRVCCRLDAVLCEFVPGGISGEISAAQATRLFDGLEPEGAVARVPARPRRGTRRRSGPSRRPAARHREADHRRRHGVEEHAH